MPLDLTIGQPRPNQEIPIGVDFVVTGGATSTGDLDPHPIESVTVQVGGQAPVEAELRPASGQPTGSMIYRATVQLQGPGSQEIVVVATDEIQRRIRKSVSVSSPGQENCQAGVSWMNYTGTQTATPEFTCAPVSIEGLTKVVRRAEAERKRVHAFGSKWSFSDCALTTDFLINTQGIAKPLQSVQSALRPGAPMVFHVEAGITIRNLYGKLSQLGLALETMGGSSGQTLAGAVSTGTHGGDKFLPPLADSVLALHLVGTGGTQYWIEPTQGITDPGLLRTHVVPAIDSGNIIYDDATFNACLVSFGCMGIIYAAVLRVRPAYDLVETTVETNWARFKGQWADILADQTSRFLQVVVNPYRDSDGNNLCLMTTRSESFPETGPGTRPSGDLESAVRKMIANLDVHSQIKDFWHYHLCPDNTLSQREKFRRIVQDALQTASSNQRAITAHYGNIMRELLPPGRFIGSSYSVMDTTYGQSPLSSEPGYSIELFFPVVNNPGLDFVAYVDTIIALVNAATDTVLTGYISLRFMGQTRATIGMQQWPQTCAVEISVISGVQGVAELITRLYQAGISRGALPHWGQQLDLGVESHASRYGGYLQWRQVFAKMSNNFTTFTFANQLSDRWGLTTRDAAQFVSQTVSNQMTVGESQTVTVTMRNVGVTTWTSSNLYVLGSLAAVNSTTVPWGYSRASLPTDVPPGATVMFQFTIIAPNNPGGYPFQWRMMRDERELMWFGESSPSISIAVDPPPNMTTVPDVYENDRDNATSDIEAAGLVAEFGGDLTANPSYVVRQRPEATKVVRVGSTVTCTLKKGRPNLIPLG